MWQQFHSLSKDQQDAILNELYSHMFIHAWGIVRNKADAMDIVQESWVKILQNIDRLRDRDKLLAWAKTIAANTAYNLIKRKEYARKLLVAEEAACRDQTHPAVDDELLADTIRTSLASLEDTTRQIFIYKYYYDWKDQDIADKLSIPLGTVKAKLHRGKEKLRQALLLIYK